MINVTLFLFAILVLSLIITIREINETSEAAKRLVECPPHEWERHLNNPDDPSMGEFLLCKKCKLEPSSGAYL